MPKYRIVFDPNETATDVNGRLYRQYHIQRRRWGVWHDLTHDFRGCVGITWDPYERHQSRYGSREQCLERIRREESLAALLPLQIEILNVPRAANKRGPQRR